MLKISEVAQRNGLDASAFEAFMIRQKTISLSGFNEDKIREKDEQEAVRLFREHLARQKEDAIAKQNEQRERQEREDRKRKAISEMLVTSGFNFDGYTITRYSGYISGDDAIQIERNNLFAGNGQTLTDALVRIRIQALKELKEAAYDLGCNAVIGVDFDYMTFEPETIQGTIGGNVHLYQPYVVCVTANGNAVIIEKN